MKAAKSIVMVDSSAVVGKSRFTSGIVVCVVNCY